MDFELYHDESLVDGFWHGMLLVPIDAKQKLIYLISQEQILVTQILSELNPSEQIIGYSIMQKPG